MGELLLRAAIFAATLAYTCAEWLRFRHPAAWRASRAAWTLGAGLLVLHSAAAFIALWIVDAAWGWARPAFGAACVAAAALAYYSSVRRTA